MKSIREFLERQYIPRNGDFNYKFDIMTSIELSLKYLLFCAEKKKKVTYKSLAELSNVPESYINAWSALGMTMGKILNAVYAYCEDCKLPELTNLCVKASTGLPSIVDGEYIIRKDVKRVKETVDNFYKQIDGYKNWDKVISANKFAGMDKISSELFIDRDNFAPSLKDVLEDGTREDIAAKVAEVEARLRIPSRIAAIITFVFPIVFMALWGKAEFSFAWLLWIPVCLALWCLDVILKICLPRFDKYLDK
jgi:hypothetical protein